MITVPFKIQIKKKQFVKLHGCRDGCQFKRKREGTHSQYKKADQNAINKMHRINTEIVFYVSKTRNFVFCFLYYQHGCAFQP